MKKTQSGGRWKHLCESHSWIHTPFFFFKWLNPFQTTLLSLLVSSTDKHCLGKKKKKNTCSNYPAYCLIWGHILSGDLGFPGGTSGKELTYQCRRQETWVWSLGQEDPVEESMATLSSIFTWRTPWTEEPGRLQFTGSQRVGYNWIDLARARTHTHTHTLSHSLYRDCWGSCRQDGERAECTVPWSEVPWQRKHMPGRTLGYTVSHGMCRWSLKGLLGVIWAVLASFISLTTSSFSKHSSSLLMSPVSPTFSFPLLSMFLFSFSLKFGVS